MTAAEPTQRPKVDPRLAYEDIVDQLEQVLERLESGGLSLDAAVAAYGQGVALSVRAQQLLDEAELRIEQIRTDAD